MTTTKRSYQSPNVDRILMDKDISLALASPWGDPNMFVTLDTQDLIMEETILPIL